MLLESVNKENKDLVWIVIALVLFGLFLLRLLSEGKGRLFIPVPGDVREGQFCPLCIGSAQGRLRLSSGGGYMLRCSERPMKHFRVVNDEERAKIDQNPIAYY